jgi:hypothetical protein
MNRPSSQEAVDPYAQFHGPKRSQSEKAIARNAFQLALQTELEEVMRRTKELAGKIKEPHELWELEAYLTRRRHQIDREYQFRSGVLHLVLGGLIRKGRIRMEDLDGLGEDKLEFIRRVVAL